MYGVYWVCLPAILLSISRSNHLCMECTEYVYLQYCYQLVGLMAVYRVYWVCLPAILLSISRSNDLCMECRDLIVDNSVCVFVQCGWSWTVAADCQEERTHCCSSDSDIWPFWGSLFCMFHILTIFYFTPLFLLKYLLTGWDSGVTKGRGWWRRADCPGWHFPGGLHASKIIFFCGWI